MNDHERTYLERALMVRFSTEAGRFRDLTDRAADVDTVLEERAAELADIAEWLDHVAGHPETDSPTGNLVEAVLVGLAEALSAPSRSGTCGRTGWSSPETCRLAPSEHRVGWRR